MQQPRANVPQVDAGEDRQAPIARALNSTERALSELEERLAYLEDRLSPVLTPTEPKAAPELEEKATPGPLVSEVALALGESYARILRATARVERIVERLEL